MKTAPLHCFCRLVASLTVAATISGCALTPDAEAIRHPEQHRPAVPQELQGVSPATREYVQSCERLIRKRFNDKVANPLMKARRLAGPSFATEFRAISGEGAPPSKSEALAALIGHPVRAHLVVGRNGSVEVAGFESARSAQAPEIVYLTNMFRTIQAPPMPETVVKESGGRISMNFWINVDEAE